MYCNAFPYLRRISFTTLVIPLLYPNREVVVLGMANFNFGVNIDIETDATDEQVASVNLMDDDDIHDFVTGQKAKTTSAKERLDLNVFKRYCGTI